jgi:NAD(P)-dependent dehydrogenase (short-subunit alcohol dehydrogenase family)
MIKKQYLFVSGASSGIGAVICKELSKSYNLVLHGRDLEKINSVLQNCENKAKHILFLADLERYDLFEELLGKFMVDNKISISGFIHCAGLMKMIPAKMYSVAAIQNLFSVNLFSATIIVKTLLQRKYNSDNLKNIIFISSNISNFGAKAFGLYSASKSGLDGLMRSLAVELAPKIRVNSILPGAIRTNMTSEIFQDEEKVKKILDAYPLGEGYPQDIANTVEFLLSENSRWITGQQITIDGGRTVDISG